MAQVMQALAAKTDILSSGFHPTLWKERTESSSCPVTPHARVHAYSQTHTKACCGEHLCMCTHTHTRTHAHTHTCNKNENSQRPTSDIKRMRKQAIDLEKHLQKIGLMKD